MKIRLSFCEIALFAVLLLNSSCSPIYRHPGIPTGLPTRLAENYPDRSRLLAIPLYCHFPFFFNGNMAEVKLEMQDPFRLDYPYDQAARKLSGGWGFGITPWQVTAGYHKEMLGVFLIGSNGKIIFAAPRKFVRRDDYAYAWQFQYAFINQDWQQEMTTILNRQEYLMPIEAKRFFVPPELQHSTTLPQMTFVFLFDQAERAQIIEFINAIKPVADPQERTGVWILL